MSIPVTVRSKERVYGLLFAGIARLNPAGDMDVPRSPTHCDASLCVI